MSLGEIPKTPDPPPLKRLLRKLQRPFQERPLKWGDILFPERSPDRHQKVATTLQYESYASRPRIQIARSRKHHLHGEEANNALTI